VCVQHKEHRSASGSGRKSISKIVLHTEQMKNTPTHVYAKTAFVGGPSAVNRLINYFSNFLSFSHYFLKCFELVYRKT
jgi:hypothetical protein